MKEYIVLVIIVLATLPIYAQDESEQDYPCYCEHIYNGDRYIYSDAANVRSGAGTEFEMIDKLACGHRVSVVQNTAKEYVINGIFAYWYKITYEKDNQSKEGYIWGGNLSFTGYTNEQSYIDSIKLIVGVEKRKTKNCLAQIKVLKNDIIYKKSFEIKPYIVDSFNDAALIDSVPLGVDSIYNYVYSDIVKLSFGGWCCGCPLKEFYFVCTSKEIIHLIDTYNISEACQGSFSEEIILPSKNDYRGIIIKLMRHHEYDEDCEKSLVDRYKTELYKWDGKKLTKLNQNWKKNETLYYRWSLQCRN